MTGRNYVSVKSSRVTVRTYLICIRLLAEIYAGKRSTLFLTTTLLSVTRVCCDKTAEAMIERFLLENSEMS